jgi:hypothetical protein
VDALSQTVVGEGGAVRAGGDWRTQLQRYLDCQRIVMGLSKDEL